MRAWTLCALFQLVVLATGEISSTGKRWLQPQLCRGGLLALCGTVCNGLKQSMQVLQGQLARMARQVLNIHGELRPAQPRIRCSTAARWCQGGGLAAASSDTCLRPAVTLNELFDGWNRVETISWVPRCA